MWFTWTSNGGGRANLAQVTRFAISSSSGYYYVTAHFVDGGAETIGTYSVSHDDALAVIDAIISSATLGV